MPKSRAKARGGRLQTVGLSLTLLTVAVLVGSGVAGLFGHRSAAPTPPLRADGAAPIPPPPGERVRVEVLNASGVSGLAREGTRVLRDRGFDVVYFGNAGGGAAAGSVVLDRTGKGEAAREVADALGIRRVDARPDSTLFLEATVILGKDWEPPEHQAPQPRR